jgi:3-isopropylmalate/(R)-2-methylmalate dehydratase small subunit
VNPVRQVTGRAVPLDRRDVDTDQIIPSDWLKRVERHGYGAGLFQAWRADPRFVLNDARFRGANILIAGANFGCGSSREHAAWALADWGFGAIIAPSFADIFRSNGLGSGLVLAELPEPDVVRLLGAVATDPTLEVTVSVETGEITAAAIGFRARFPLDDGWRARLLAGQDEIDLSLTHADAIAAYESGRAGWLPRVAGL